MRLAFTLFALGLGALSAADRIIIAPNANKVRYRQHRFEYGWEPSRPHNATSYLAIGLTREIETEIQIDRFEGKPNLGTINASYQYLVPIVNAAPGIAVGFQDGMDRTADGFMAYLALTFKFGLDGPHNQFTPMELTAGYGVGRRNGMFIGVMLPFTWQFRLMTEYNLRGVAAGLEYFVRQNASIRWTFREGQSRIGARWTVKF